MSASEHSRRMRKIRAHPGVKALEKIVEQLPPRIIVELLDKDGLSSDGSLEELRDRRLRFDIMRVDSSHDVPVYPSDYRGDALPVTTAELLTQQSREDLHTSWQQEELGVEGNEVLEPAIRDGEEGGEGLRASSPSASEPVAPREQARAIASDSSVRPSSVLWNTLATLPGLFRRSVSMLGGSQDGKRALVEQNVNKRDNETVRNVGLESRTQVRRVDLNEPRDQQTPKQNIAMGHSGADNSVIIGELTRNKYEGITRRAFSDAIKNNNSKLRRNPRSEVCLSRLHSCDRDTHREPLTIRRSREIRDGLVSSDSESEWEVAASGPGAASSGTRRRGERETQHCGAPRTVDAVRALKDWQLSFSDSSSGESEEFIERLKEMQHYNDLSDRELLRAVPCALSGRALQWFRSIVGEVTSFSEFVERFREQFGKKLDREDLYDELRNRTQAPEENVSDFLTDIRYIIAQFDVPPSESRQLRIVLRNLHPKFRHYIEDREVRGLEDLRRHGVEFERRRKLDARYVPPPSRTKARIPAAAYKKGESALHVASAETENSKQSSKEKGVEKQKRKSKNREETRGGEKDSALEVRVEEVVPVRGRTNLDGGIVGGMPF